MAVRIGVIGVGLIGQDHIRRLTTVLSGPTVVAVSDSDAARARAVAAGLATEHRPLAPSVVLPGLVPGTHAGRRRGG